MVNLVKRARKKKNVVVISSISLLSFFVAEIVFISTGKSGLNLSFLIGAVGFLGALLLQVSYFLERKFLVQKVIENLVEKKAQAVDLAALNSLLKEDIATYLQSAHGFLPRSSVDEDELLRVEGLSSFVHKYKTYSDLNLLGEFSKEILIKNQTPRILGKSLIVDLLIFSIPMLTVQIWGFKNIGLLISFLCVSRALTVAYYFKQYGVGKSKKVNTDKIEHFLFGSFDDGLSMSTRIELSLLENAENNNVFFLIDAPRKSEIETLIRVQTSGDNKFKDWSVISAENSVYKNKVKASNAFILFPSDMLFPFEEMQEFIAAFDKVIIVDSSPSYAPVDSEVFYLDHNQEIKKVHLSKNIDRLSGDKGLILRNFKKNNLDLFLTQVEKKIISKEPVYLVYEDTQERVSCDQNFVYPSGDKMVSISSTLKEMDPDYYCDLSEGGHQEKLEKAKSFLANCSYHKMYSNVVREKKLKKSFRAS